ncbi:MAG: hypothetical protein HRU82_02885 [Nitrospira sp.]|nr:MAG: hypothetical protein HRU82_02885 [Nitrospira sp.]
MGEDTPLPENVASLKAMFIDCYVNLCITKDLSDWLQDLGLSTTGTRQEQLARLRPHIGSLVLPAESLSRQVIWYLHNYDATLLGELCRDFGLDPQGTRERLIGRIYRAVGTKEGWFRLQSEEARSVILETFLPIMRHLEGLQDEGIDWPCELMETLNEPTAALETHGSAIMTVLTPGLMQEAQGSLLQHELHHRVSSKKKLRRAARGNVDARIVDSSAARRRFPGYTVRQQICPGRKL